ncbi:HEAT repeat domain-containing protein [bacterium]|nr:HEAT repeat domain-containing protein [bacterium]
MKTKHLSRKQILLYLLKELSHEKDKSIEDHLKECTLCQNAFAEEKQMIKMITGLPRLEPSSKLMERYRLVLKSELSKISAPGAQKNFLSDLWESFFYSAPTKRFAATFALILLGVVLGQMLPRISTFRQLSPGDAVLALQSSLEVSDFKVIPTDDQSDRVEIRFNTVQRQSIKGNLGDPGIQYVLSYILENESGDDVRLKTIQLLEDYSQSEVVQGALIRSLERDTNPGIRLKAIRLLKSLPVNEKIKDVLVYALFRDTNSGVQIEAANALNRISDDRVRSFLNKKAKEDEYTRALVERSS